MDHRVIRIVCPGADLPEKVRAAHIINNLKEWAESDSIKELMALYGHEVKRCSDFKEYMEKLQNAAEEHWDFRRKMAETQNQKTVERWQLKEENFASDNEEFIMGHMKILGFTNITEPLDEPDYICPLGGARRSNLDRCVSARTMIDKKNWHGKNVVALSGTRPIDDIEKPYLEEYAPFAQTEYDAICGGLEKAFRLDKMFEEKTIVSENINSCAAIMKYENSYQECSIYSLAAPSSEPDKRRADSADTFTYFLEQFNIAKGKRILLVTNCIYQPRQLLNFMMLALKYGIEVDCVGFKQTKILSKTTNYLQELKATIDTIKVFCEKYY